MVSALIFMFVMLITFLYMAYFILRLIYSWVCQISFQKSPQLTINPQAPPPTKRKETMRDYKEWTGKQRLASLKKTKAAIAEGIIPPPTQCNRCGKTTGRIDYHNHDYSDPIKYLEQICQGCHTRLHRLENKELKDEANKKTCADDIKEIIPKPLATKVVTKGKTVSVIREEMHRIRVAFAKSLGLNWPAENPNPSTGYKLECNTVRRQQYLVDAQEYRNQYAELVAISGTGKDILDKMDRNLINRDRQAIWKS
jgi:hypothetical protein